MIPEKTEHNELANHPFRCSTCNGWRYKIFDLGNGNRAELVCDDCKGTGLQETVVIKVTPEEYDHIENIIQRDTDERDKL